MANVVHMFISGRVQGVGFRYFTCSLAKKYNINGFVRNLSDGRVEVYATGDEKNLKEFCQKVKQGPTLSVITHVAESNEPILSAKFNSFEILEDE